ncbi:recombinase family protein [Bacillus cereus]|uniref:recombinase family protein n=1 Tax=Bacillus mobilis TaxID=2026190 RepID=UPI0011A05173|nr:recombinase family protein [Bacillus mobilis]MED4383150.1 recombinase family protein [Bacillus mobilis]HDX9640315.1 recombinase family protein [Bacillus mobilis]
MKCVIYRRVSTDMQVEEGISLDMQRLRLEQYAKSQGWVVVNDYCDEGYSAKNTERPAFQKMIKDMTKKQFDIILVYRLDRFTRSVSDLHSILKTMDEYNVKFKSSTEIFDTTTATGRMFITLVATLAQWERETTAERVRDSMQKKAELGLRNGAKPPMGYDLKKGNLYINHTEAEIVKYIFEMFKTKGVISIVKSLNSRGVKTKQGKIFNYDAVRYIINNPIYIGQIRWGDDILTDIAQKDFESIIDKDTWYTVQQIQNSRKIGKVRLQNFFVFSNVLKCARCGKHFLGSKQVRDHNRIVMTYRCSSRHHKGTCDMPQIPESVIEKEFLSLLEDIIIDLDDTVDQPVELSNLQEQHNRIQDKKARLKYLFIEGDISQNEYKKEMVLITQEEITIQKQLATTEDTVSSVEIKELLSRLKDEWFHLNNESKKSAVNSFVSSITIELLKPARSGRNPIAPVIEVKDLQWKY